MSAYDFEDFVIDEYSFERFQANDTGTGFWKDMTYTQFLDWNMKCFDSLNETEQKWIIHLCQLIKKKKINLIDEEICCEQLAENVYFNEHKEICIMSPR
jgi:hypothetical protein